MPTAAEAHPHTWTPPQRGQHWAVRSSGPGGQPRLCCAAALSTLYLVSLCGFASPRLPRRLTGPLQTHNGDCQLVNVFSESRTYVELLPWLRAVLGQAAPAVCDSVAIAGAP